MDAPPDLTFNGYDERVGDGPGCPDACSSSVPDPFPPASGETQCSSGQPWCGAAACGNGHRDTCQSCAGGCYSSEITETCDVADLGGKTCGDFGYVGGTLGCNAACDVDTSRCATCAPDGCRILACGPAVVLGSLRTEHLVLAASDTEIVAMWTAPTAGSLHTHAHFARFSPTLEKLSEADLGSLDPIGLAAAPAPSGWTLATGSMAGGLDLWSVDASGAVGAAPVHLDEHIEAISAAAAPGGATLVAWMTAPGDKSAPVVRAALFSPADGSTTAPVTLLMPYEFEAPAVAAVEGGFLVAATTTSAGVQTVHLDASGALEGASSAVAGPSARHPQLLAAPGGAHIVYQDLDASEVRWRPLDLGGAPVGPPVTLAGKELVNQAPAVAFGSNTLVLFAASGIPGLVGQAKRLEYARFDAHGVFVSRTVPIVADPKSTTSWAMARRGPEAVVAWIAGGCQTAVSLARLAP
jgi:hypothetical protein